VQKKAAAGTKKTTSAERGSRPRAYHHGDLRRALLDAALGLFAERGGFDFTFRELARAAEVTHQAPYRHFAGKAELLTALREEGLAALASREEAALAPPLGNTGHHDPRARVTALGEAYVRFALDEPLLFRLVMSHPLEASDADAVKGSKSYRLLERTLAEAQSEGVVRTDLSAKELALGAWGLVHGMASLLASGRLPKSPARIEGYVALLSTLFFQGADARP
jgi:AcrR family transcriptional regulator